VPSVTVFALFWFSNEKVTVAVDVPTVTAVLLVVEQPVHAMVEATMTGPAYENNVEVPDWPFTVTTTGTLNPPLEFAGTVQAICVCAVTYRIFRQATPFTVTATFAMLEPKLTPMMVTSYPPKTLHLVTAFPDTTQDDDDDEI
jgi:hypothetical protein